MESPRPPRLRWRWAILGGLWADLISGAVLAYAFAGANGVVEPADRALLMLYGGLACAVLLFPLNLVLGGIASRLTSRRPGRPPDEILTTSISLHLAMVVAGYGLAGRASRWWFYERGDGFFSVANTLGLLEWLGTALAAYVCAQTLWRLRVRPAEAQGCRKIAVRLTALVGGYGLLRGACQGWLRTRSLEGVVSAANALDVAAWGIGAAVSGACVWLACRLRRPWELRLRTLCAGLTIACFLAPFAHLPARLPPPDPTPLRSAPFVPRSRVLWIGIDGGDWKLLKPMMNRGELPVLADLCRRGTHGTLVSVPPYGSQPCWVTAATGVPPETHGINSRLAARFPGVSPFIVHYQSKEFLPIYGAGLLLLETGLVELVPAPRYMWRAEPIWTILDRAGGHGAVIGWPSTWPAEPIQGLMVTDRFYFSVWEAFYQRPKPGLPGKVYPSGWLERARALRVDPRRFTAAEAGLFFDPSPDLVDRFRAQRLSPFVRDPVTYLGRGVGMDMTDLAIAAEVAREGAADLIACYTTGFDLAVHGFWIEMEPEKFPGATPSGRPELRDVLPRYCRFLDAEIGRLARQAPPDTVILISSDHGVTPSPRHPVWPACHDREGILLLAGPPIRPDHLIEGARLLDMAATVAYLLGIPPPARSEGRVLRDCFQEEFLLRHPLPPESP